MPLPIETPGARTDMDDHELSWVNVSTWSDWPRPETGLV